MQKHANPSSFVKLQTENPKIAVYTRPWKDQLQHIIHRNAVYTTNPLSFFLHLTLFAPPVTLTAWHFTQYDFSVIHSTAALEWYYLCHHIGLKQPLQHWVTGGGKAPSRCSRFIVTPHGISKTRKSEVVNHCLLLYKNNGIPWRSPDRALIFPCYQYKIGIAWTIQVKISSKYATVNNNTCFGPKDIAFFAHRFWLPALPVQFQSFISPFPCLQSMHLHFTGKGENPLSSANLTNLEIQAPIGKEFIPGAVFLFEDLVQIMYDYLIHETIWWSSGIFSKTQKT